MPGGYLTRERYLGLSSRAQPTFASIRGRIYDIFEKYILLKRRRREHDSAERYVTGVKPLGFSGSADPFPGYRIHKLLGAMRGKHKLPGHPVQFLLSLSCSHTLPSNTCDAWSRYTNEAQDNLIVELFREYPIEPISICHHYSFIWYIASPKVPL